MKRTTMLVACLWFCALSHPAWASTAPVGKAMTSAAQAFLASLNPAQVKTATMAFDDPARLDWHNIPKEQRKGMQFRSMSQAQRELCLKLIQAAAALSNPA